VASTPDFGQFGAGSGLDWDAIRAIFDGMRDYMCIHRAVLAGEIHPLPCATD
jgi:hypothetical protein